MTCAEVRERLGEYLDGHVAEELRSAVTGHLARCAICAGEYESLRALVLRLAPRAEPTVPADLWEAIQTRLEGDRAARVRTRPLRAAGVLQRFRWGPLASAAAIVLLAGLSWLVVSAPWEGRATAAHIDFRPLLERADADLAAGIGALLETHGGEAITLERAAARLKVRVRLPDRLPSELALRGMYLLNLGGDHRSLAFHMEGPKGQLLLLQCPAKTARNYGGYECLPCHVGARQGQIVEAGALRLIHLESPNVCICVVSTLKDETELRSALAAIPIEF